MTDEFVLTKSDGRVLTLTMNRPQALNAINLDLLAGLESELARAAEDRDVGVVVLEGAGGNFCSGADVSFFLAGYPVETWIEGMQRLARLIRTIRELPQPVVAKLRGAAVGGGVNLALACDFVVAADTARLRENFAVIGCVLDGGGTYFLPRLVGAVKARELAMLGDEIDGRTAADIGLIYKSASDENLDREVDALAGRLARRPPMALALIKEGLEGSLDMSLKEVLERETAYQAMIVQTDEHRKAVNRFLETIGLKK